MPEYDAETFDPPAPVAYVTLNHPATGASISGVPMLMDTGADVLPFFWMVQVQVGLNLNDKGTPLQSKSSSVGGTEQRLDKAISSKKNLRGSRFYVSDPGDLESSQNSLCTQIPRKNAEKPGT